MNKGNKILVGFLVCALAMGCGFAGGALSQKFYNDAKTEPASKLNENNYTDINKASQEISGNSVSIINNSFMDTTTGETVAEKIYKKVMVSVVSVTTTYEVNYSSAYDWFFGRGQSYTQEASAVGTGFIVDAQGYIVTNSHVVNDGDYKTVKVSLYNGSDYEAQVLWYDATLDLAVLKISSEEKLTAVTMGDSDTLNYGSYAAVIGNPLGLTFERSITQGIISGLDRTITVTNSSTGQSSVMEGLIQTDAAINSGNSGGPLLNFLGQVVGIASANATSGENMGFAIPVNTIKPIVNQIIENGSYHRVYLGIQGIGIDSQTSLSSESKKEMYGNDTGIYVYSVTEKGGAEKAGLQKGDVILSVNGTKVGTMNRLYTVLVSCKAGDSVSVEFLRNGQTYTVNVTVSE